MDRAAEYQGTEGNGENSIPSRVSGRKAQHLRYTPFMGKPVASGVSPPTHWKQRSLRLIDGVIIVGRGPPSWQRAMPNSARRMCSNFSKKAPATSIRLSLKNYQSDNRNEYETTGIELDAARNAASVHKTMLNVLDGQMRVLASL